MGAQEQGMGGQKVRSVPDSRAFTRGGYCGQEQDGSPRPKIVHCVSHNTYSPFTDETRNAGFKGH